MHPALISSSSMDKSSMSVSPTMDKQFQRMSFPSKDKQSQRNLILHSLFLDSSNVPPTVPVQHFVEWLFTLQNSKLVAVDTRNYPSFLFLGFLQAPDAQMFITRELTWNDRSLPIKLAHKDMDTSSSTCIAWNPRWSWKSMCHSPTSAPQAEFTPSTNAQAQFSSSASASPAEFSSSPYVTPSVHPPPYTPHIPPPTIPNPSPPLPTPYPSAAQLNEDLQCSMAKCDQLQNQLKSSMTQSAQFKTHNEKLQSQCAQLQIHYEQSQTQLQCSQAKCDQLQKVIMSHATAMLTELNAKLQ